ncbi:hypothetical protein ElP_08290 [Tautonia plasticadhaerens]|uniref:Uncharacterized protein n=1 Tax=Tautonia plasticadhaerens TaxID=2527974 RepID=A0A518GWK7_9BACT|nr:hypothetical protein ElP_08290 [Tautonia plasticadhaerens]
MLKYGAEYVRPELQAYEARMRSDQQRTLRRRATAPGDALVSLPATVDG